LCRNAFESDLYVGYRVDTLFECGDLTRILPEVSVLVGHLLFDLAYLSLYPLIFELKTFLLQLCLSAARLCRRLNAAIRTFPQAFDLLVDAGYLALFRNDGRMLFLIDLKQIIQLPVKVSSFLYKLGVCRRVFDLARRTCCILSFFLAKILDQTHLPIVRTDRI